MFLFKRTIREAAIKHGMYATFMAKPMQGEAGSAMHSHQSVVDIKTGKNIFSAEDGSETELFRSFIGGMQHYIPKALVMMAPDVNSYRRLTPEMAAPVNTAWGYDNRTTAFRVPNSDPQSRRVPSRRHDKHPERYSNVKTNHISGRVPGISRADQGFPRSDLGQPCVPDRHDRQSARRFDAFATRGADTLRL